MVVFPNAKINLGLNILSRRPDGYHNISSLLYPVGWTDILEIVPAKGKKTSLTVSGRHVDCPPESNLVMKAYRALCESESLPPVDIYLRKIIPDGAGLGGGSADAAFTLLALNTLFSLGLSKDHLAEIAGRIGADCPFFIYNTPMLAEGTGTTLSHLDVPKVKGISLLIIKPDIHISTARAYSGVTPGQPKVPITEIIADDIELWKGNLVNDFEESLKCDYPEFEEIKHSLYNHGAIYASLSGSGSAVYGMFRDVKMAENARKMFEGMSTFICQL